MKSNWEHLKLLGQPNCYKYLPLHVNQFTAFQYPLVTAAVKKEGHWHFNKNDGNKPLIAFNPLQPGVAFLYPSKTSENLQVFLIFSGGIEKQPLGFLIFSGGIEKQLLGFLIFSGGIEKQHRAVMAVISFRYSKTHLFSPVKQ